MCRSGTGRVRQALRRRMRTIRSRRRSQSGAPLAREHFLGPLLLGHVQRPPSSPCGRSNSISSISRKRDGVHLGGRDVAGRERFDLRQQHAAEDRAIVAVQAAQDRGCEALEGHAKPDVDLRIKDRAPDRAAQGRRESPRLQKRSARGARLSMPTKLAPSGLSAPAPQRKPMTVDERTAGRERDDEQDADQPQFLRQDTDAEHLDRSGAGEEEHMHRIGAPHRGDGAADADRRCRS